MVEQEENDRWDRLVANGHTPQSGRPTVSLMPIDANFVHVLLHLCLRWPGSETTQMMPE